MAKYLVSIQEVHIRTQEVEATDIESAKEAAEKSIWHGQDPVTFDFHSTLDKDNWEVVKIKD